MNTLRRLTVATVLAVGGISASSLAQEKPPANKFDLLKSLSMEELLDVQVTSVSG